MRPLLLPLALSLCPALFAAEGDLILGVKSASGPLTPVTITKTASRAVGWNSDGTLTTLPLSGGTWGSITGTLASQTDLQTALNAKLATTTAASTYQPLNTKLTTFGNLTDAAGVFTSNGSATYSWTQTTTGGNGTADSGKLLTATSQGGLNLGGTSGTTGTILLVTNGHAGSYAIDAVANVSLGTAFHVGMQAASTTGISSHFTAANQTFIDLDGSVVDSTCKGIYGYMPGALLVACDETFNEKLSIFAGKIRFTTTDYTSTDRTEIVAASPSGTKTITVPAVTGTLITTGDTATVTSTMVTDGTLVNADINASAAIALSKLASSTTQALGLGSIELGHASDTTLARSSAGVVTIEGAQIATLSAAQTFTAAQVINNAATVLFDVQNSGTSRFKISTAGVVTLGGAGSSSSIVFSGTGANSSISSNGFGDGLTCSGFFTAAGLQSTGGGAISFRANGNLNCGSSTVFGWASSSDGAGTIDTALRRDGAAGVIQVGAADSATPQAAIIKGTDGSGKDISGGPLTLGSGLSTGTGAGGDVITTTSMSGSSGSSANTAQERARAVGRFKDLTEATATNLVSIALASGKVTGGTATITVWANDGTDYQALTSAIRFAAVNKAGTITATCTQTDGTTAASAGTLTVTYDATASGNNLLLRANATSSLTQTTLRARLVITALNGDGTQTVTPQ